MTKEIWLPVLHHEDYVEVSNHGRVANVTVDLSTGQKTRTVIVPFKNPCGYLCFMGCERPGRYNLLYVHEEVAWSFKQPYNEVGVRHLDGNILNNDVSNLEWTNDIEERDLYNCCCKKEELETFGAMVKQLSYANRN